MLRSGTLTTTRPSRLASSMPHRTSSALVPPQACRQAPPSAGKALSASFRRLPALSRQRSEVRSRIVTWHMNSSAPNAKASSIKSRNDAVVHATEARCIGKYNVITIFVSGSCQHCALHLWCLSGTRGEVRYHGRFQTRCMSVISNGQKVTHL